MPDPVNGRLHEPTLRELTSELDGLRGLLLAKLDSLRELIDERDRLYKERDESQHTAVAAALTAVKEQTTAAFAASKEAIQEAKKSQDAYNITHNDLVRKMDDQNKATMPRAETEARFRSLDEKVDEVKLALASGSGVIQGTRGLKDEARANMAILIALSTLVVSIIVTLLLRR